MVAIVFGAGCFGADDGQCPQYETGADYPAYELRDPSTGMCQPFGGGGNCTDPCSPCALSGAGEAQPDWAQCFGVCEGLDETTCKATSACRAAYAGGTYYQCWGVAPSGPIQGGTCSTFDAQTCSGHDDCIVLHAAGAAGSPIGAFTACAAEGSVQDPGSCVGTVTCTTQPPACPANTIAGRRNGCWTGYCIPYAQCDSLPVCSTLTEMDCISRTDCSPIYEGQSCTCNGTSCSCQSWTFDSCKAM